MQSLRITHQQVIALIDTLPTECLQSVFDFALFLKQQPIGLTQEIDLFGQTAEEIAADEEAWHKQFASSPSKLRELTNDAAAEYQAGLTKPMKFSEDGRLVR